MKKLCITLMIVLTIFASLSAKSSNILTIYSYDSFGWIEKNLISSFEKQNNCKVNLVKFESSSKVISRLILEKRRPKADIAIGITPSTLITAKSKKVLQKYKSKNISKIKDKSLIFDKSYYCTPYDYGSLAIIYDPSKLKSEPKSFDDILKMKNSIIIQDPRTSSTGSDFLFWTIAKYGKNWEKFWNQFSKSVLTASPGWSEAFSKFSHGEAPMMVSYATDGAYSMHNYKSSKYKAFIPDGEGFIQIEGASVVKGSKNTELAKKWIDFMLTNEFQSELPLNQWMFPITGVKLPDVYRYAIVPEKTLTLDAKKIERGQKKWLDTWVKIMKTK